MAYDNKFDKKRNEYFQGERSIKENGAIIKQINEFCTVIDMDKIKNAGIGVPVSFESKGYGSGKIFGDITFNDYFIAKKYITDGTVDFLAGAIGVYADEYISAGYNIRDDGKHSNMNGFFK